MTDARELLNKMAVKERKFREREFFAPYTERSQFAIVKMTGMQYRFRIVGMRGSGIGVFKPIDPSCAKYLREADLDKIRAFFDMLPKIHFILSYETEQGWVGQPINIESARKTLGLDSEAIIKNVTDAERFDVVTARFDGEHFWYDEPFVSNDFVKAEGMRKCFLPNMTPQRMKERLAKVENLTPEDYRAFDLALASWAIYKSMTTEDTLRQLLEDGGATLGSYVVRGSNIEVRWKSVSGADYTSVITKNFDVVSAGICLSSEDNKFHLKDMPHLVEQGERRGLIYRTNRERNI